MLSKRLTRLFEILQCSNTDIAQYAGCSPSYISRMKNGSRIPTAGSRALSQLAEGIYRYAVSEDMLPVLLELTGTDSVQAEDLLSAVSGWLLAEGEIIAPHARIPKSRQEQKKRRQSFGLRLEQIMSLLELSNAQAAAALNVDVSLISRYRGGVYAPLGNSTLRERLSDFLFSAAQKKKALGQLAELCRSSPDALDADLLSEWLFQGNESTPGLAELLFYSIENYIPGKGIPASPPAIPPVLSSPHYRGTDGLRSAVVRFLTEAAQSGGQLLLYSDEPMDWMSSDPAFFALWAHLMVSCIRNGIQIRIIHNIDRNPQEMAAALTGWLPLYISGMIEPYLFRRIKNPRFFHTIFLRPGGACIFGVFPAASGSGRRTDHGGFAETDTLSVPAESERWYDYITDPERLQSMEAGFRAMLGSAVPLLQTFPPSRHAKFRALLAKKTRCRYHLLSGFSIATMPEELLLPLLSRAALSPEQKEEARGVCRERQQSFLEVLQTDSVHELLVLPDPETIRAGGVRVNLFLELSALSLSYRPAEFALHLQSVVNLLQKEANYHVTLLSETPFHGIQILTANDMLAVLRSQAQHTAFVFSNTELAQSAENYFRTLCAQNLTDRAEVIRTLERLSAYCGKI